MMRAENLFNVFVRGMGENGFETALQGVLKRLASAGIMWSSL